jgi:protein gp37
VSTKIGWTDETWNPLLGCRKVSPGCTNCYAISTTRVREASPNPAVRNAFAGLVYRHESGHIDWTGKIALLPERLVKPLRWHKPRRIFVNSMSDLFADGVPDDFIAKVFAIMAAAPQHTYQVLTKRHGRMRAWLAGQGEQLVRAQLAAWSQRGLWVTAQSAWIAPSTLHTNVHWPLPNVWIGVSVEDQTWAERRIPSLLAAPAAIRWISAEPLLGAVDLRALKARSGSLIDALTGPPRLDWVVAGGESGPGARPMHPHWPQHLRDQCSAASVSFNFKQWGDWSPEAPDRVRDPWAKDSQRYRQWVDPTTGIGHPFGDWHLGSLHANWREMHRVGKKTAGRELDAVIHDDYPDVADAA